MLPLFDSLRDITLHSMSIRMLLAVICGGLIGMEREMKRRPAGFRTHILICLGASMTTLTGEFLFLNMKYSLDITRMGASVAVGMGFIGAGTIIVTRHRKIKGLTTAAGLWTAAIVGLSVGAGFYEGGIIATLLILMAELLLSKVEHRLFYRRKEISIFVRYHQKEHFDGMIRALKEKGVTVLSMEVTPNTDEDRHSNAICQLYIGSIKEDEIADCVCSLEGIDDITIY
ncbi:MAG: MgtC/SapB family protein [Bacillota bacterium]|nr:MgtC/SapB family protein [Bacillota bacterium]